MRKEGMWKNVKAKIQDKEGDCARRGCGSRKRAGAEVGRNMQGREGKGKVEGEKGCGVVQEKGALVT